MFDNLAKLFKPDKYIEAVGKPTSPSASVKYRAWCIVLSDGRVGYIDHYKSDGKFGVRPVDLETGLHFPNPSQHWTNEQRLKNPEELALALKDLRAAQDHERPAMYRENTPIGS